MRAAKGDGTAQLLDHLKKVEMATEAKHLLKGSGWLPEVLRRVDLEDPTSEVGEGEAFSDVEDLERVEVPAFLTAELETDILPEDASLMAAE